MGIKFRDETDKITPYKQGKPAEMVRREFGLERIEKLASNENQFGASPKALAAIQEELQNLHFYPEGHAYDFINALSEKYGQDPERFVVGNGGEGLIWNISMALINPGDEVIIAPPTFDIYTLSAKFLGAEVVTVPLEGDSYDVEAMVAAITDKTKIFWLCTPNNPTGHIASKEQIDYVFDNVPEDVVIVLDEAYYEFAYIHDEFPSDSISRLEKHENLVILRTLSKAYGLAGIRIGYLITSPLIAGKINMVKQTLGVNRLAQIGGLAALDDDEYMNEVVQKNKDAIDLLQDYYDSKGWNYFPSYANFSWVDCGEDTRLVFDLLQREGVIVRPGYLWGWDTWLRISTGTEEQMKFFIEKMDVVLEAIHS